MKTIAAIAVSAMLAGTLLSGGCVSKSKYDELLAVNRRCNERLSSATGSIEALRSENNRLQDDLQNVSARLEKAKQANSLLETTNADLVARLNEVNEMYKKLLAEQGPGTVGPIRLLPQPLHEALQGFAAEHPEMVEYLPSRGMVKFKSDLTFKPGSDFVTDEAKANLRQFVEILQNPAAREFHVYVAGHTDNMPIQKPETKRVHPNNWYLSVHRAVAVQDVLADAGLDEERMAAMGFGKWHPLVPNKPNQGGHPKNRRVEIFLVSPDRLLTVPQAQPLENDAPAEGS